MQKVRWQPLCYYYYILNIYTLLVKLKKKTTKDIYYLLLPTYLFLNHDHLLYRYLLLLLSLQPLLITTIKKI